MPFPTQRELEIPLLRLIESLGGEAKPKQLYEPLAAQLQLTADERRERMESTGANKWENDVQWARQRLVSAGHLDPSVRGLWRLTPAGRARLNGVSADRSQHLPSLVRTPLASETLDRSPSEVIENAHRQLREALASELIQVVRSCSPTFFERLVVDLLVKMGYGGTRRDAGRAIGQSGDEGIDGIINEDRLGLDSVYVQAKRWNETSVIGRPEIQKFAGALAGHRARKGVFITTSSFTRDALEFVSKIDAKIVLIDGKGLTSLMIDFGVGVTPVSSYEIKKVDSDYFAEDVAT
jgi:restriction system protein